MCAKRTRSQQDDEPGGPGAWIVTFSDCMTLLLCFFVMLLTFSSFDEITLRRLASIFRSEAEREEMDEKKIDDRDSIYRPVERVIDRTEAGSEKPLREMELDEIKNPQRFAQVGRGNDVYKDKRMFYVSSQRLFWGRGSSLTGDGRSVLDELAELMRLVPCNITIGATPQDDEETALRRACAVVEYLTDDGRVPAGRLAVVNLPPDRDEEPGRQYVRVSLLARDTCE